LNALHDRMAGSDPVDAFNRGTRRVLTTITVLTWPLPLTQPILAGVSAVVLCVVGLQTGGWRQVTRRQGRYLSGFTVAAVLGAGPMILVCALALVVFTLVIGIGLMIGIGLLAFVILKR